MKMPLLCNSANGTSLRAITHSKFMVAIGDARIWMEMSAWPMGWRKHDVRRGTPRGHPGSRLRGSGVAARGAPAAASDADNRVVGLEHAFIHEPMGCCFCPAAPRPRLDRGPHRRDRISLG